MKIAYDTTRKLGEAVRLEIGRAEQICTGYAQQGYDLTLRQLYYQFVARGFIPNTQQSYKRLGDIINVARLAGLLSWNYIVDRTRNLQSVSHWDSPSDIIDAAASSFRLDKWIDQPTRVEVWVEKEALAGVVERAGRARDVAWFSCRGYVSQSEMWGAAQRLIRYIRAGQRIVILHLGDHDPSGLDMTRDITDRLNMFITHHVGRADIEVRRIALNMDQVRQYDPPPNPAKLTDSRANAYVEEFGYDSWELDALDPTTLNALINEHIDELIAPETYADQQLAEERHRELLADASQRWTDVVDFLDDSR